MDFAVKYEPMRLLNFPENTRQSNGYLNTMKYFRLSCLDRSTNQNGGFNFIEVIKNVQSRLYGNNLDNIYFGVSIGSYQKGRNDSQKFFPTNHFLSSVVENWEFRSILRVDR